MQCEAITKSGERCKFKGSVCPTHSLSEKELSNRNSKSMKAAFKNDPIRMATIASEKGKKGFKALTDKYGKDEVIERIFKAGVKHRLNNPSFAESITMQALDSMGVSYQQEIRLWDNSYHTTDFMIAIGNHKLCIEVDGFRFNSEFFESKLQALHEKVIYMKASGYKVLVLEIDSNTTIQEIKVIIQDKINTII